MPSSPAHSQKEARLGGRDIDGQGARLAPVDLDHFAHPVHKDTEKFVAVFDNEDANATVRFLDNLVFGSPGVFRTGTYGGNIKFCGNSGAASVAGCQL